MHSSSDCLVLATTTKDSFKWISRIFVLCAEKPVTARELQFYYIRTNELIISFIHVKELAQFASRSCYAITELLLYCLVKYSPPEGINDNELAEKLNYFFNI